MVHIEASVPQHRSGWQLKQCVTSNLKGADWLMAAAATAAAEAHTNLAPTPLDSQVVQLMHSHQQPEEGLIRGHLLRAG